jgi:hypothetical protein
MFQNSAEYQDLGADYFQQRNGSSTSDHCRAWGITSNSVWWYHPPRIEKVLARM